MVSSQAYGSDGADPSGERAESIAELEHNAEETTALLPGNAQPVRKTPPFNEIAFLCFGLWMSMFTSAVSATVITNLQLTIGSYFEAADLVSWLGAGYLLGLAALTPLYGGIAQIMGRRSAMILAFVLFSLGTVLCAMAPSMGALIAARIVAGCGGGGLLTLTAVVISDTVSIEDRGVFQGYVNLIWAAGSALGALAGGYVADLLGWRWAFWMQIPPLALSFALILWKVHPPRTQSKETTWQQINKIDWLGFTILTISISTLLVSCSLYTRTLPDRNPLTVPLFIVFALSLPALLFVESRHAKNPILPLGLMRQLTPAMILASTILLCMNVFARFFMCPIYIHVIKGAGGAETGLLLLPSSLTLALGAVFGGYYMRHSGRYKGFTIISSLVPVGCSISFLFWGTDVDPNRIWIELAVASFANGIIITNMLTALVASIPQEQIATGTSVLYLARALGQVLGAALSAGLQQVVLASQVSRHFTASTARRIIRAPEQTIPLLSNTDRLTALRDYLVSLEAVFKGMVVTGFLITLMFCCIKGHRLGSTADR